MPARDHQLPCNRHLGTWMTICLLATGISWECKSICARVLLLHSIGDDLGETVPGNRNTMPGDGSRKLTMGLLDCWPGQSTLLKNSFFKQGHFPWVFSGSDFPLGTGTDHCATCRGYVM
jgi:hypothetical protein